MKLLGLVCCALLVTSTASAWQEVPMPTRRVLLVAECPSIGHAVKAADVIHGLLQNPIGSLPSIVEDSVFISLAVQGCVRTNQTLGIKVWGAKTFAFDGQFRYHGELVLRTTAATVHSPGGIPPRYMRYLVAIEINDSAWMRYMKSKNKPSTDA